MKTKEQKDRQAFIDRLEKKYSQKLDKLYRHQKTIKQSLRTIRGIPIDKDYYLDFEDTEFNLRDRHLAY
jgi:hypothetical protein